MTKTSKKKSVPIWLMNAIASVIAGLLILLVVCNPKSLWVWILVASSVIFLLLQFFHPGYKYWRAAKKMFGVGCMLALLPSLEYFIEIPDHGFLRFVDNTSPYLSAVFLLCGLVLTWFQYKSETIDNEQRPTTVTIDSVVEEVVNSTVVSGLNAKKIDLTVGVSNQNHSQLLEIHSAVVNQNIELTRQVSQLKCQHDASGEMASRLIDEIRDARSRYDVATATDKTASLEEALKLSGENWSVGTRNSALITIAESLQNRILSMDEDCSSEMAKLKEILGKIKYA